MTMQRGLFLAARREPDFTRPWDKERTKPESDHLSVLQTGRVADRRTLGQIWRSGIEFRAEAEKQVV